MKTKPAKRVPTADVAMPAALSAAMPGEIMVGLRTATIHPLKLLSPQKNVAPAPQEPMGVLVVLMDRVCSPRSMDALAQLALRWQDREVVFLSAASARVGRQAITLFPRLFYNAGEQVTLDHLWKLLPWRTVVMIKTGKVCCLPYRDGSNVQPLNTSK